MSKLIKDATLLGIADAIRAKTGTTDPIKVGSFASAIEGIDTGATEGMFCWAKHESKYADSTQLLIEGEFADSIGNFSVTNSGVTLDETKKRLENPALYFNGSANLTVSDDSALDFGTDDFTVDFWVHPTKNAGNEFFVSGNSSGEFFVGIIESSTYLGIGRSGVAWDTLTNIKLALNSWQHVAVVRSAGTVYFYVNGSMVYSAANSTAYSLSENFNIGSQGASLYFTGYLDQVRVSNTARWTSNFAPPANSVDTEPIEYALSDDLNTYPQDGYHTDGYYYRLMENDIQWDERGQYAWSKNETEYVDGELTFPTTASATLTATSSGGYTLTSGSSGGWGYTYLISDLIDTTKGKLTLNYTIAATGLKKGIFVGVADTPATTYTNLNHSYYLSTGANEVLHWQKGTQIAVYETVTTGDVLTMTVEGTTMTVSKNGTVLFTDTLSFTDAYACIILYTSSTTYGVIECTRADVPSYIPVGYLVGNEESAYPNDGYADDGYYYMKVGATKVSPKYASGTTSAVSAKVTVSGLGFKPYAVMLQYSTAAIGYGVLDGASGIVTAYSKISSNNNTAATFVPNNDGFEFTGANWSTYSFNWYAIGY